MSDAEKVALGWLDSFITYQGDNYLVRAAAENARTLKAMLAEPRLPAEPTPEMLRAMFLAIMESDGDLEDSVPNGYRALYAHLTKPKTEKVWHIVFCNKDDGGSYRKDGYISQRAAIHDAAHFLKEGHAVCVELIEVPT